MTTEEQLERRRQYQRAFRERRNSEGLCRCGAVKASYKSRCKRCLLRESKYAKERRKRRASIKQD